MAMIMRRAPAIISSSILLRSAAASGDRTLLHRAPYSSSAAGRALPPPILTPRSISLGVAGALSFSLSLSTAAEAKAAPLRPDLMPKEVVLYQYQACPFCNKIRAFLDYYDIPYKIVEVNPLSKKEIKWSDYKKVPILVVDGQQMVDSSG